MKKYKLIKQLPEPFDKLFEIGRIFEKDGICYPHGNQICEINFEFKGINAVIGTDIPYSSFEKYFEEVQEKPKSIWDLKHGDGYWHIGNGSVFSAFWDDDGVDNYRRDAGFSFLTEQEANKELEKRKAFTRIKKYIHDNGLEFQPNWEDGNQMKYYIYYDHGDCKFKIGNWGHHQRADTSFHMKNEEDAQKVIDNCGSELKIIIGIEQ